MPRGTTKAKGEKEKEKEEEVVSKKTQQKTTNKSQKKELTKEQRTERIRKRLSDRAYLGRNVSQEKLASRLTKLYSYLCDRKQKDDENEDDEDREPDLDNIAAQLIQSHLLENSENNIKILTACCLYDIFRVYAPDAPYRDDQLELLFRMFIDQLAGLEKGPNNPHFNRRLYLLNGLAVVKAFTVLPANDELVVHMFRTFFDIIYGLKDQPITGVTSQLNEILALYFEDSQVSSTLLDEIFDALTGRGKESTVLHNFISNVIKNSADRLQEPITKYLNDLLEHQSDSDARERCHQIIFEVNKISPNLLLYVMPQLEAQLTVENDEIRTELVRLLSRMFGHKESTLHTTYRKLFEAFLKRFTDKNEQIRETMLDFLAHYLKFHNDYAAEFSNLLAARLRDPVEDVRHKAVTTACEIAESRPEALTEVALDELFLRMRDRKSAIRKELTVKLGLIYRDMLAKHKTTELPTALRAKYMSIPSKVLQNYTVPGEELRVDQVLEECLLFQTKPSAEKKAKMLVELVQNLAQEGSHRGESASFTAFTRLLKEKKAFQAEFNKYLTLRASEDLDDEDEDAPISRQLRLLSQLLPVPNPDKSYEFFQKMNKLEKKIFSSLAIIADIQGTFAKQAAARTELLQKIGKKSTQYDHMLAVTQKLRHTAVSSESIPFILKALVEELDLDASSALPIIKLVELLSSLYPEFFHESFQELSDLLDNPEVLDRALAIIGNVGAQFQISASSGKSVTKKLTALLSGGTPYQARHSVRALHALFPNVDVFGKILKELVESLDESANLATVLSALGQIAKLEPAEFKKHSAKVIEFVSDEVFSGKVTKPSPRKPKKKGSPLASKTRLASGDLKGFGAQLLAKYLEGRHNLEKQESDTVSSKYIGLIVGIIEDGKEAQEDEDDEQRRVDSVVAACAALLRIAAIRRYEHVFTPQQFETFAWVARDSSAQVRRGFAAKLFNKIKDVKLHVKYLAIPSLFVLDKDFSTAARSALAAGIKARRTFIKTNPEFIEKNQSARTEFTPEYALLHLIHLIAHCPDFKGDAPAYLHTSRYLSFFTNEIVQESDHCYFLKTLLENLKLTKDAVATQSSNFLVVNEIAILTLQEKSEHKNWKPTNKKFPTDFLYPATIFIAPKAGSEPDAPKRYLPQGWKLPDQSRKLLSGAAGGAGLALGGGGGGAGETAAGGEKSEKPEKQEKAKAASKPTPKRRLVYEKEDAPAKKKKAAKKEAKGEKSNVALRPRRTIQSYFEKSQSDDEEVEEESEEEYEKPSRKATSPKRTPPKNAKKKEESEGEEEEEKPKKQPAGKKGKGKKDEKEESEEEKEAEKEEEKEEKTPKKQPAGKKGKGKKEEKEESEEEEEEKPKKQPAAKKGKGKGKKEEKEDEEEEEKPKKQPAAKKGKGKKEEVEEEEEEKGESEEEETPKGKGKKQNGKATKENKKTKESPAARKKRKANEESEEEEEEVVEKKKTKKGK